MFAAPRVREPLLGVYALHAEWMALLDTATERTVAQIKLAWWQDEMLRLTQGKAVHPVSRFLASQPGADVAHFEILSEAVEAAMLELGGVPLERGSQLASHSTALLAGPLRVASLLAGKYGDRAGLDRCTQALATAQHLARAIKDYRRDARIGRVPFAVDELLGAGIENEDLLMPQAPPRLQAYLDGLLHKADDCYLAAAREVPGAARADLRHLQVLAALGRKHLHARGGNSALTALKDMLLAWGTARRAAH